MAVNVKSIDTKKTSDAPSVRSFEQSKQAANFLRDVKSEFNKITWTDKEELKLYTKLVVGATFICGMSVYFADLLIRFSLETLEKVALLIFG